ncbi:pyridoxal 5'-phosphate synthase glutaminase subunit PdxT [Anaerocolumna sp. AGMB13025]|uniref:pyridoxal 5'-phosphate synthase glutaminase subunit PdxT n=1 Tax=Anaerocolumna sp. AGMB13025 TaxID=3039116 RepID=UPI00242043CD|nr:pyridoxal 5'-phosphate synthase glutaminase subunit PdxT [Anaerocolumna sp. AGMB13025]WFR60002.1 pyridoxal 5'-phosphate synthase glutaminase subunit PdxT [Anaerocolumna sp. AGMB13025]
MTIGVLALQGAFIEHENALSRLETESFEIRKKSDLNRPMDGLILPGGESTVMGKLLKDLKLFDPLKEMLEGGLPVLGTCAGLILLASHLADSDTVHFGTLPVTVRRNAYGRQLGSFYTENYFEGIGMVPMKFIRAPYIEAAGSSTQILAVVDNRITAVRYKNQLGISFHPELTDNLMIHRYFLNMTGLLNNM